MANESEETKENRGFSLDLKDGVSLMTTYIPGHENPYLGVRFDDKFVALAEFISPEDMDFLHEILSSRAFVVAPIT